MRALVISGGGAKFWFGSGALACLKKQGQYFDHVYGTSTGAICTLLWMQGNPSIAWDMAEQIKPTEFVRATHNVAKISRFAQGKPIADNSPMLESLQNLFPRHTLDFSFKSHSIASNLITQKRKVFDLLENDPDIYRYVVASCSIPALFPPVRFNDDLVCVDGGAIDNTLLDPAISAGCDEIVLILLTEKEIYRCNTNDVFDVISALTDGTLANSAIKDLKLCEARNFVPGFKRVKVSLIRPQQRVPVELFDWSSKQARMAFDMGYTDALNMELVIDPKKLDKSTENTEL